MEDGRIFDYVGIPEAGYFVKDLDSAYDKELMKGIFTDFQDARILGDGVVNYEVKYGLEEK